MVPEIVAMAFPILGLSWVRAGVRRLSHPTFIYCTQRQEVKGQRAKGLVWTQTGFNVNQHWAQQEYAPFSDFNTDEYFPGTSETTWSFCLDYLQLLNLSADRTAGSTLSSGQCFSERAWIRKELLCLPQPAEHKRSCSNSEAFHLRNIFIQTLSWHWEHLSFNTSWFTSEAWLVTQRRQESIDDLLLVNYRPQMMGSLIWLNELRISFEWGCAWTDIELRGKNNSSCALVDFIKLLRSTLLDPPSIIWLHYFNSNTHFIVFIGSSRGFAGFAPQCPKSGW